jgi:hypothetical protein
MGAVLLARDVELDRLVAIKVLPPDLAAHAELRERFLRETRTAAGFNHPNIVSVFAVEQVDGLLCLVMEFVDGETLTQRVRRAGPLSAQEAVRLFEETGTITRMVEQTQAAIEAGPAGPVALVGSSLGGFVAVHAAALDAGRRVDRLVLLAPAFDFGGNRLRQLGDTGIDEWRRRGRLRFFHFAFGEEREVGFGLYEDAARYDAYALSLDQPILIIQGRRDASVDPKTVEAWARERPNVDLRLVDDEHQLSASMDLIWRESSRLLGLSASPEPT